MNKSLNIPQSLLNEQLDASNPNQSAWVSANAGSGKTHVLTQRVIRLMLEGNSPDRILCLTFTKAAAANMKNRVFETLSSWTMMEGGELKIAVQKTTGKRPSGKLLVRARQLFAEALDTPGGLKIQTIHAFCESLLHQFPLEANIAGHFEVIQDITRDAMLDSAQASIFGSNTTHQVTSAYAELAVDASDAAISMAISEIIAKRYDFRYWLDNHGTIDAAIDQLYSVLSVQKTDTSESIRHQFFDSLANETSYLEFVSLRGKDSEKKTDQKLADALDQCLKSESIEQKFDALSKALLTKTGELRSEKTIATNTLKNAIPDIVVKLHTIGRQLISTKQKIVALKLIKNSRNLFLIAEHILSNYEQAKNAKGLVDYDDLIRKCVTLLDRRDIRDWIRYRLDRGIDHLLVDEAQDTSPAQWQIINAVTEDFHVGEGASHRTRTVFVVGDEKQSIYSFQGADPKEFSRQQKALKHSVEQIGKQLKNARLNLSFRSTKDILHAVDLVFENDKNAKGLTQSDELPPHDSVRTAEPGEVQVWPLIGKKSTEEPDSWLDPVDRDGAEDPTVLLAERITSTIRDWVGKPLPGTGKNLAFSDILVLVRKRDRFITALTRKMKDAGLSVAGADRLQLLEHIAVEDLISAGRFALLPNDDLNLACLLKSIFFNVTDPELFELSHRRQKRSLLDEIKLASQIQDHSGHTAAKRILPVLHEIQSTSKSVGPFEFYAWLLGSQNGRQKILSRLGTEAEDVVDAFMDEILSFVRDGGLSLETFIKHLTTANPEIKRELELERDEVRILTVHASKGLEASVVFLVDSCGEPWIANHRPKVLNLDGEEEPDPFIWAPSNKDQIEQTQVATSEIQASAEGEYRRLLYVGMTRAADRLIVCGYHGIREPNHQHWHQMVQDALEPSSQPLINEHGEPDGIRWVSEEQDSIESSPVATDPILKSNTKKSPAWLGEKAIADPPLPKPLTPSGAYALIDASLKEKRKSAFDTHMVDNPYALEIGTAVHKLLELLPEINPEDRISYAKKYVMQSGITWSDDHKDHILNTVEEILANPEFQPLFTANSKAEANVVGSIKTRSGLKLISGQIDRLIVDERQVSIIDYKTNRNVPGLVENSPAEYITQLALYRHLVSDIYPTREVRCLLLWTSAPKLVDIPQYLLDEAIAAVNNG